MGTAVSTLMVYETPTSSYLFYLSASYLEHLDGWMDWDLRLGVMFSLPDLGMQDSCRKSSRWEVLVGSE